MKMKLALALAVLWSPAASACPQGFALVENGADGSVCVQIESRSHVRSFEAGALCEEQGARLCGEKELRAACESGRVNNAGIGWEWSMSLDKYTSASLNGSCDALAFGELTHHAALRCCK